MSLKPFDPSREPDPKSALFNFQREPDEAPSVTSYRELQTIRRSEGLSGDALREFWADHWNRDQLDLDSIFPQIAHAAWRLTRGLQLAKGKLAADGYLGEMDQSEWSTPTNGSNGTPGTSGRPDLEALLVQRELSILPPPPPDEWLNGDKDASFYDAAADLPLCLHNETMMAVARRVGLTHTRIGEIGAAPLLDINICRQAWPKPREIIAYEAVMVDEAVESLLTHGHFGARRDLMQRLGLVELEVASLMLLARRAMRGMRAGVDSDGDKATMVARLEDLAARCRLTLDLRAELMVYKTLATVQGITKTQGTEDDVDGMVDVVGEVIAEDEDETEEA
jgi:hypothetical protein